MAYDERLAERVRGELDDVAVAEKRMFGGLAFLVNGNMAVAVSSGGGLLVRVDARDANELLDQPGVAPMQMGARAPMAGWLHVEPSVVADDDGLATWVDRGVGYALTLPPK